MVSHAFDTLTSMSATARLQGATKRHTASDQSTNNTQASQPTAAGDVRHYVYSRTAAMSYVPDLNDVKYVFVCKNTKTVCVCVCVCECV